MNHFLRCAALAESKQLGNDALGLYVKVWSTRVQIDREWGETDREAYGNERHMRDRKSVV